MNTSSVFICDNKWFSVYCSYFLLIIKGYFTLMTAEQTEADSSESKKYYF